MNSYTKTVWRLMTPLNHIMYLSSSWTEFWFHVARINNSIREIRGFESILKLIIFLYFVVSLLSCPLFVDHPLVASIYIYMMMKKECRILFFFYSSGVKTPIPAFIGTEPRWIKRKSDGLPNEPLPSSYSWNLLRSEFCLFNSYQNTSSR